MSGPEAPLDVLAFLRGLARELAEIHSGADYSLWRSAAEHRVNQYLSQAEPFSEYVHCWAFSGDGAGSTVGARFGGWAIDRLVANITPEQIVSSFFEEIDRNVGFYEDVSPVLGAEITEICELDVGVRLVPPSVDIFDAFGYLYRFAWPDMPAGGGFLVQSYTVTPAFERCPADATGPIGTSVTLPASPAREEVRRRCRLAVLLGSQCVVELPVSVILAGRTAVFSAGGTMSGRRFGARPLVAYPADLEAVRRAFKQLANFTGRDSLFRAIDRLGRSRLATHPVDRAIDLGIAIEIMLMHDQSQSNTEITYKIGSRAAWLLGSDAEERAEVFEKVKQLYAARSTAVHSGVLPSKSKVDLEEADEVVSRVIRAILERGSFPDWMSLTMGGR